MHMRLHQVKDLWSENRSMESELRAFKRVIQWLTTIQIHATPVSNTFKWPLGLFGIRDSSERSSILFGGCGFAETSPRRCRSCGLSVKSSNNPTYEGKRTMDDSPLYSLLWNVTSRIWPRPVHRSAQRAGKSMQCYNWKVTQWSRPCTVAQWVLRSNGSPLRQCLELSSFSPTRWTWSNANGNNWA